MKREVFLREVVFLGENALLVGGNVLRLVRKRCFLRKMSSFGWKSPYLWEKAGLSGRKCHLDGSECDVEERQVVFLW